MSDQRFYRFHFRCVELSERDAEDIRECLLSHRTSYHQAHPYLRPTLQDHTFVLRVTKRLVPEPSVSVPSPFPSLIRIQPAPLYLRPSHRTRCTVPQYQCCIVPTCHGRPSEFCRTYCIPRTSPFACRSHVSLLQQPVVVGGSLDVASAAP